MKLITLLLIISCAFSYPFQKSKIALRGFGPRTPSSFTGGFNAKKYSPLPPVARIPIPIPPPSEQKPQELQQQLQQQEQRQQFQQQLQQQEQQQVQEQVQEQRPVPIFIRGEPIPKFLKQSDNQREKIRQQARRREQFGQQENPTQEELQQALAPVYEQLLNIRDKLDNDEQLTEQQILDLLVMLPDLDILQPLIKELNQFSQSPLDVQTQEVQNTYEQLKEIQNQVDQNVNE